MTGATLISIPKLENWIMFPSWISCCETTQIYLLLWLPKCLRGKEFACHCRRRRFDPWVRRSPGEGNGNPLQYSCLGNPMDREAWWATVHGVMKSQTWLNHHHHPLLETLQPTEAERSLDMTTLMLTLSSISWEEQCRGDGQFRGTSWPQVHTV